MLPYADGKYDTACSCKYLECIISSIVRSGSIKSSSRYRWEMCSHSDGLVHYSRRRKSINRGRQVVG